MTSRYDKAAAQQWLTGTDATTSPHTPATIAEQLGVDDDWPGAGGDTRDHAVIEIAAAAIRAGVLQPPAGITTVELINVVDRHHIHTGLRIATTDTLAREAIGPTLTADDLTDGRTGLGAALAALANLADAITETAAQLAPLLLRTPDGHEFTAWTDGHAIGFHVTSPTGRREVIHLNPSGATDDGIATVTLYHGAAGEPADEHAALTHVDLLTRPCPGCTRPIPDTATDCDTCRTRLTTPASSPTQQGDPQ